MANNEGLATLVLVIAMPSSTVVSRHTISNVSHLYSLFSRFLYFLCFEGIFVCSNLYVVDGLRQLELERVSVFQMFPRVLDELRDG